MNKLGYGVLKLLREIDLLVKRYEVLDAEAKTYGTANEKKTEDFVVETTTILKSVQEILSKTEQDGKSVPFCKEGVPEEERE